MTTINASAATEAVFISPFSNQFTFASGTPLSSTHYTAMSTGGDDLEYFGTGIDTAGIPPASGLVTSIDVDLSDNNFGTPDVEITGITRPNAFGNPFSNARIDVITNSAEDFFNEVLALDDTMTGSAFDDTFKSGGGNDVLNMGSGIDSAQGGAGNDTLNGEGGNDTLLGEADNDILDGGAGNDTLNGGTGADAMTGGSLNDTYFVDNVGDTVTELAGLFSGIDLVQSSITIPSLAANVENLTLTGVAAINGTGNGLDNVITGNGANNVLLGLGGDDRLNGGFGVDDMQGSFGNDTYVVDNALDSTVETLAIGGGTDRVESSVTRTLGANLENLTLTGAAAINGTGNSLANTIVGNGAANDLRGLGGVDTLNGGGGDDDYNYFATSESNAVAEDRILSFTGIGVVGVGDQIDVSVIDADTTAGAIGNQAFSFSTTGAGGAGTLWVENAPTGTDSIVFADVDGGGADFQVAVADGNFFNQGNWIDADFIL